MNADVTHFCDLAFISGAPGTGELVVLFIIILLLFGPRKLPSIAKSIGKTIEELRRASNDFKDQIMKIDEHPSVDISAEEVSEEEPFDYGSDDGFDEFNMHEDDPYSDDGESAAEGDTAGSDEGEGKQPGTGEEPALKDEEDSSKDDNK